MAFVDEYQFIETTDGRTKFIELLNKESLKGWRPIWQNMTEDRAYFSCYMYRKISTNVKKRGASDDG